MKKCFVDFFLIFFTPAPTIKASASPRVAISRFAKKTFPYLGSNVLLYILARKQLHCRRFGRTVSHGLRGDALGGARRRSNFFITLPRERYVCVYYIYIVCFTFPRECNDKYMYTNRTCCSSRSLTYTPRQNHLPWSFYMPQYVKYLPNL